MMKSLFSSKLPSCYSPLTGVHELLHSPKEVQTPSQQQHFLTTRLPEPSYTPGSFPCQTETHLAQEKDEVFPVAAAQRITAWFSTASCNKGQELEESSHLLFHT